MPRVKGRLFSRKDELRAAAVVVQALESKNEKARQWAAARILDETRGKPAIRALVKPLANSSAKNELTDAIRSLMGKQTVLQTSVKPAQVHANAQVSDERLAETEPLD